MKIQKIVLFGIFFLFGIFLISQTSAVNATVCCEKTTSNLFCQNVPSDQCATGARQVPTSCESTSFCKPGTCFDSTEGTCLDNTPQNVCNLNKGIWSEEPPAQCNLGCCVLGDQAAFVSLTRCKRLSGFLGLQTNFKSNVLDEVQCVLSVQNQDRGACVYDQDFQRTCKFTTRSECSGGINGTGNKGQFYKNTLCSAEELGTNCGPTNPPKTTCVSGKEEVYFVDTCGNPANIYDSTKISDKRYWSEVLDKSEACALLSGNSKSCGNCNYLEGSICRKAPKSNKPNYGENICTNLNCLSTKDGKSYKHGESWCVYNDRGTRDKGENSVGSRFFRHLCINGEEVLEQCADFRQEECIQDSIPTTVGPFSQGACRVNRWQDCIAQTEKEDCENTDRRDCLWQTITTGEQKGSGKCAPKNSPGIKFWEGQEAKGICAQANTACVVTYKKGLFSDEEAVQNADCLTPAWTKERTAFCNALGDCGAKINWVGDNSYKEGFKVTRTKQ